jgi:predicted transposase YdaD
MSYDNLTKILAEKYPERFATWLLGAPQTNVEILKTELSIEPIRADSLTFLKTHSRILHLEFQTCWISEPMSRLWQVCDLIKPSSKDYFGKTSCKNP